LDYKDIVVIDSLYGDDGFIGVAAMVHHGKDDFRVLASNGEDWEHVSISLINRCPTWQEMCHIKSIFWNDDETVIQYHPAKEDYVNYHPFCLHLWKPIGKELPKPPTSLIGPKK
jgi:hypothetical protein